MTNTPELDRAIEAAEDATEGMPYLGNVSNHDRTYARALILELWKDFPPLVIHSPDQAVEIVRAEFLRRAGLEEM
jgi:hypothetical protein